MEPEVSSLNISIKQRRRTLDLTQEDLADCVGCSTITIQKIELGERRPSRQVAQRLAECLKLPADQHEAFVRFARGEERAARSFIGSAAPSTAVPPIPTPNNLPTPLTPLIGRKDALEATYNYILRRDIRLLTLTGVPGVGKTRLSLDVAAQLLPEFKDGVFFVELASIGEPNLVASTIGTTLGYKELGSGPYVDGLKQFLRDRKMLLVLDNFEQVLDAAPLVIDLLRACPALKILVTSREALHIIGEQQFPVQPLEVPDLTRFPDAQDDKALLRYPSVELFVQRAGAVDPGFALADENYGIVAAICTRLEGLPLAIELAAARIKMLTPIEIFSHLDRRLKLLTGGPRHLPARLQTLRGAIDWSYRLLSPTEQTLFACLGVFVGGTTMQAIEAVYRVQGDLSDMLEGVSSLVDKGLLRREEGTGGASRFVMLETIHEYAREKLLESGEYGPLQREHALHFVRLAEEADLHLITASQVEWLHRLEEEHEDLRAALKWAREEDGRDNPEAVEIGLRLAGALGRFWSIRGYHSEGREELANVLARGRVPDNLRGARAKALSEQGRLIWEQGDLAAAQPYLEESLAIYRELGDSQGIARLLNVMGNVLYLQGEVSKVRSLYEEALARYRELGDKAGIAQSLGELGLLTFREKDYAAGRSLAEESLAILRALGDKRGMSRSISDLGTMNLSQGDYSAASDFLTESIAIDRELGDKGAVAHKLGIIGGLAVMKGDYALARALYEEGLVTFRELGVALYAAWMLCNLGHVAVLEGDYPAARLRYAESLPLARKSGDKDGVMQCLGGLGTAAAGLEQGEKGARLLGASDVLRERIAAFMQEDALMAYEHGIALTRARLGDEQFERAWQEGRAMTMEQAIAYALEES